MSGGGTQRSNIFPGQTVAIVLKSDQQSGILTHGTVQALLTNSENHHRGIKVRLTSGQVGRVQKILNSQGSDGCEYIPIQRDSPRSAPRSRNLGDFLFPGEPAARTTATTASTTTSAAVLAFPWSCAICTFENTTYELECEMCNTLRQNYGMEDA